MPSTELVTAEEATPRRVPRNLKLRLVAMMRPRRGTHRVWDRMASLERQLQDTRALNLTLTRQLDESHAETLEVRHELDVANLRVANLEVQLRHAINACEANSAPVSFEFQKLDSGPRDAVDTPTYPVPVAELVIPDEDEEDEKVSDDTRRPLTDTVPVPVITHAPSWAETTEMPVIRAEARNRVLHADQSSTGTFRVTTSPFASHSPTGFPGGRLR